MITPEGEVKKKLKKLLDRYYPDLYYHMSVPTGYGKSTVDFLGCFYGFFFAIETKAPGKKPTPRQEGILADIEAAKGTTFVITDGADLGELEEWLDNIVKVKRIVLSVEEALEAETEPWNN